MDKPPLFQPVQSQNGAITSQWRAWLSRLWTLNNDLSTSGTTENRPTTDLYIGKFYFDTTIGCPIWLKRVYPSVLWVDGAGAPV